MLLLWQDLYMSKETMQVTIDEQLKRRFKAACVMDGYNMSEIVSDLVSGWLEERDRKSVTEEKQDKTIQKTRRKKASNDDDS